MVIDKETELETKLLKEYPDWQFLPKEDLDRESIELFLDIKKAKRICKKEQKVLEKQFEVLTSKSEEISRNFSSLQQWVDTKNQEIQKHELADQKCRHRYLPKYREDLAQRNRHCVAEYRIKVLYKKQLKDIIKEIEAKSTDPSLVKLVKNEMKACRKALKEMPDNPIPEELEHRLQNR